MRRRLRTARFAPLDGDAARITTVPTFTTRFAWLAWFCRLALRFGGLRLTRLVLATFAAITPVAAIIITAIALSFTAFATSLVAIVLITVVLVAVRVAVALATIVLVTAFTARLALFPAFALVVPAVIAAIATIVVSVAIAALLDIALEAGRLRRVLRLRELTALLIIALAEFVIDQTLLALAEGFHATVAIVLRHQNPQVMFGMLEIVFGGDAIARQLRITGQAYILFIDLLGITADPTFRSRAIKIMIFLRSFSIAPATRAAGIGALLHVILLRFFNRVVPLSTQTLRAV
jgi:hypothetical protein